MVRTHARRPHCSGQAALDTNDGAEANTPFTVRTPYYNSTTSRSRCKFVLERARSALAASDARYDEALVRPAFAPWHMMHLRVFCVLCMLSTQNKQRVCVLLRSSCLRIYLRIAFVVLLSVDVGPLLAAVENALRLHDVLD